MNTFIKYTGNYEEVMDFTASKIRCTHKGDLKMYVYVPMVGCKEIHEGDYILKQDGKISIRK